MSETKIYVHPQFFTYHGPAEKAGNSHFICINCPNKIKNNGKLKTISVSDISRQNLYSHLLSKHPGLLSSFKAACIRGEQTPSKSVGDVAKPWWLQNPTQLFSTTFFMFPDLLVLSMSVNCHCQWLHLIKEICADRYVTLINSYLHITLFV